MYQRGKYGLYTRGHLWWRQQFYSIHSHDQCRICPTAAHGTWHNVWGQRVEACIYWLTPRFWRWWVNRPTSAARRDLERLFHRLRGPQKEG